MKIYKLRIAAAGALSFALVFSGAGAYAASVSDACKAIAARIVIYAAGSGINKIGVLEFAAEDGAAREEAAFASKEIERNLTNSKKNALNDRLRLEEVIEAAKSGGGDPARTSAAKALGDLFSAEAVVTGTVFSSGTGLKVLVKLNELRTGKVLLSAESVLRREQPASLPPPGVELPGFPGPYPWQEPAAAGPADLRNSISDSASGSCAARKRLVAKLNAKLVDGKARYWAARMSEPYFGARDPGSNPGSEIADRAVQAKFYELLAAHLGPGAEIDSGTPAEVTELLDIETLYLTECGFR